MKIKKVVVVTREDLCPESSDKPIEEITCKDVKDFSYKTEPELCHSLGKEFKLRWTSGWLEITHLAESIIFEDNNGDTLILKDISSLKD